MANKVKVKPLSILLAVFIVVVPWSIWMLHNQGTLGSAIDCPGIGKIDIGDTLLPQVVFALMPVAIAWLLCRVRIYFTVAKVMTCLYVVMLGLLFGLAFLIGFRTVPPRPEPVEDTITYISLATLFGGPWAGYWAKVCLARRYGWWGGLPRAPEPKSYGFPVITEKDSKGEMDSFPRS